MKEQLKNWLSQSSLFFSKSSYKQFLFVAVLFTNFHFSQVVNYVNNPSFEDILPGAAQNPFGKAKYWGAKDTVNCATSYVFSKSLGTVPYALGFQWPKSGGSYILSQFYTSQSTHSSELRINIRNRLKQTLKPNTKYCAKYYIVNTNNCPIGIDSYGIYLADASLDTIQQCNLPLTFLNPQVQYIGGIITDTLNWVPITGTFVANGGEKYMVLGNFKSNANTNTLIINPTYLPTEVNDIFIDDVSLIEYDLPAYAYQSSDAWILQGDSVYLGRERDVGIDEACMWYELPNTTMAIDTAAGIWVKPTQTTSYLVKQDICGNIKWALVTVNISDVGVNELGLIKNDFKLYPNPASNEITIAFNNEADFTKPKEIKIIDVLGREVETLNIESKKQKINIEELSNGVYYLQLLSSNGLKITKKLVKE